MVSYRSWNAWWVLLFPQDQFTHPAVARSPIGVGVGVKHEQHISSSARSRRAAGILPGANCNRRITHHRPAPCAAASG